MTLDELDKIMTSVTPGPWNGWDDVEPVGQDESDQRHTDALHNLYRELRRAWDQRDRAWSALFALGVAADKADELSDDDFESLRLMARAALVGYSPADAAFETETNR